MTPEAEIDDDSSEIFPYAALSQARLKIPQCPRLEINLDKVDAKSIKE